ncbi:MAG: Gfo/Idh/MocA family oxidoreductase [Planctomycetaceae bacterium]|nr:Gfo/Idh/MocA family oxidoreductase [Planctomycetaceae bacterium]
MVRVGIAGLGFMGWIHWLAYKRIPDMEVVAICETDPIKRAGDWRSIQGNFGPPGEVVDLSRVSAYDSLPAMLANPDIDLIDICLPPAMHHDVAIQSLNAGKHVLSEKPMSLWTDKCDLMVAAAQANKRQLMVAHVLPFFPEYAVARQVIAEGTYGKLLGGRFLRVISDPQWLTGFYDPNKIGGPMLDLHVHDAHLICLLFGRPKEVISRGRVKGSVAKYWNSFLTFDDPDQTVCVTSGVIDQQGRSFTHGFEIHLERATIHFELAVIDGKVEAMPLKIITASQGVIRPEMPVGDDVAGFEAELREAHRALTSGQPSKILGCELARDAIELCYRQSESIFQAQGK